MIDIFEEFATDPVLEKNGTWFPVGKGSSLLIARGSNRAFNKMIQAEIDAEKVILDRDDEEAIDKSDEIRARVMSRTVLLGWKTTEDGAEVDQISYKGKTLSYSQANAQLLLSHHDFRSLVNNLSNQVDAFKFKKEQEQGNV